MKPTKQKLEMTDRTETLKNSMLREERFISIEQARLITQSYKQNEGKTRTNHTCGLVPGGTRPREVSEILNLSILVQKRLHSF